MSPALKNGRWASWRRRWGRKCDGAAGPQRPSRSIKRKRLAAVARMSSLDRSLPGRRDGHPVDAENPGYTQIKAALAPSPMSPTRRPPDAGGPGTRATPVTNLATHALTSMRPSPEYQIPHLQQAVKAGRVQHRPIPICIRLPKKAAMANPSLRRPLYRAHPQITAQVSAATSAKWDRSDPAPPSWLVLALLGSKHALARPARHRGCQYRTWR